MLFLKIALVVSAAFFVYSLTQLWQQRREVAQLTETERAMLLTASVRGKSQSRLVASVRRSWLFKEPLLAGVVVSTYVALVSTLLRLMLHVSMLVAVVASIPVGIAALVVVTHTGANRRRRAFNRQLRGFLVAVAAKMRAGAGLQAAIGAALVNQSEPLKGEMSALAARMKTTSELGPLYEMADRYPSRAMILFVVAMETASTTDAGRIAPALEQAAQSLTQSARLADKAAAGMSTARYEFIILIGMISAITAYVVTMGTGSGSGSALLHGWGLLAGLVGVSNFAFGVWRGFRIINSGRGDL